MNSTIVANIFSAISAIAAMAAAIAAWCAVKASYKGVEAQILVQLRTEFSSQPMHDALRLLSEYKKSKEGNFTDEFRKLKEINNQEFNNLNNARRIIKGYYLKIYHLHMANIIDEQVIKSLISDIQFDFMMGTLEPFEKIIAVGEYNDYLFQWASNIR
ncbi:MAG: hypothetical protein Q8P28_07880 [Deltaproteobacteria bacterium]|nr:hypothetical protein [Deltaproteobacteria bacterium]